MVTGSPEMLVGTYVRSVRILQSAEMAKSTSSDRRSSGSKQHPESHQTMKQPCSTGLTAMFPFPLSLADEPSRIHLRFPRPLTSFPLSS